MSSIKFEKMKIPAASLNGKSSLPSIAKISKTENKLETILDEEDELHIGHGFIHDMFPYRQQNMYDRNLNLTDIDIAVLENDYLKAVFVPCLGGRLWSLFDKINNKELLFANPVFRVCNLANRNAWFSGGVEWNMGTIGHSVFTCSQLFVATLNADDNTPVLRMYEYERIRKATYQMDFFLPDDSTMLLCRMRIVNTNKETIPMYWWSNIAVPEIPDGRVVMAADDAYINRNGIITKTDVPISEGVDITYPVNNAHSVDFFWHVKPKDRKYVCQIDRDGYGLIETSTERLKGRKLFVWGQGPGGDRWQEFLTQDGTGGRYMEIQAGLANTQYECIPMPQKSVWEWMEAYGSIQTDPKKVHGDWNVAQNEVEMKLSDIVTTGYLEDILLKTKDTIGRKPAKEIIRVGSGWGALENFRREKNGEKPISEHLYFGDTGVEQEQWIELIDNGFLNEPCVKQTPPSWMNQSEFTVLLENSVKGADEFNWYAWMHLGMIHIVNKKFVDAKKALNRSMELKHNCWALYGLANLARIENDEVKAACLAVKACMINIDDICLAKEAVNMLLIAKMYDTALNLISKLSVDTQNIERIKLFKAFCLAGKGRIEEAESILYENGGISVPDIREGENSTSELWFIIEEKKAQKEGKVFNADEISPPSFLDFRMNVEKSKLIE